MSKSILMQNKGFELKDLEFTSGDTFQIVDKKNEFSESSREIRNTTSGKV